ncbi:MAG: CapA family protein [Okeania sp. SIO2G4]|uniref:CapA family protein n=1 Tax=unclassified Okeania TaxID=2634635 RepID=UPI0013BA52A0|nr:MULTISPECIES: CapA family protein [unclassified Okeania]NEP72849.1 CapA family protein [Okeania sp. SIO2G5]NEP93636.1 CapA family protein [Okeania sp. SIO2F5]NEQ91540.1 CapA family protein [Okeania sp. SIO2G4]
MTYTPTLTPPSLLELARSGDFKAISYWINKELKPQGISARVAKETTGYLQVLVEFQKEPPTEKLIKYICQQLYQLNSPLLERVNIIGRFRGSPNILWKQSVRIPLKRTLNNQSNIPTKSNNFKFKIFRSFILIGSVVATFILGCWVSYYEVLVRNSISSVETAAGKVRVINDIKLTNPNDPTVTLMFGGDVNLSHPVSDVVKEDYKLPFAKMDEYRKADLAMVNLENPLTRSTINSTNSQNKVAVDSNYVNVLTSGGVDLVNLANDQNKANNQQSLVETIDILEQANIHSVGAGKTKDEARKPKIIKVKGQKIAYLSYDDTDIQLNAGIVGVNSRHKDQIATDIQILRKQVDWIIVNYHWGVKLSEYPGDWQMDIARSTIDQGADLVVGHHPKVLQGAEIYKGQPIIYSLGNLISGDTSNQESDYETAILKVSLKPGKMKIEFLPIVVSKYQPQVVTGKKGEEILSHIAQISSVFHQPMRTPLKIDKIDSSVNFAGSDSSPSRSNSNILSTPTLPELPPRSIENEQNSTDDSQNLSEGEAGVDSQNSFSLPPILNPEVTVKEERKPFIKEPFIKEPFIELPRLRI